MATYPKTPEGDKRLAADTELMRLRASYYAARRIGQHEAAEKILDKIVKHCTQKSP